jgi:hypothetical protein
MKRVTVQRLGSMMPLKRRLRGRRGQAAVESAVMMSFLLLLVFGFVHFSMLATTKELVNYAAFSAARTLMVRPTSYDISLPLAWLQLPDWASDVVPEGYHLFNFDVGTTWGWAAAAQVTDNLHWNQGIMGGVPDFPLARVERQGREGILVTQRVPFGLPIFNSIETGGIPVSAFAPLTMQPDIEEKGDNVDK